MWGFICFVGTIQLLSPERPQERLDFPGEILHHSYPQTLTDLRHPNTDVCVSGIVCAHMTASMSIFTCICVFGSKAKGGFLLLLCCSCATCLSDGAMCSACLPLGFVIAFYQCLSLCTGPYLPSEWVTLAALYALTVS